MAFPSVAATTTGNAATGTSHAVTLPTHSTGQMLFVQFAIEGFIDLTVDTGASGTNWRNASASFGGGYTYFFWKIAESGSDALTLTISSTDVATYICYAIDDADHLKIQALLSQGTGTNANPPNNDMGTSRDYLWLAGCHVDNQTVSSTTPTNYASLLTQASTSSTAGGLSSCVRTNAASNENPAAFTTSSNNHNAWTIAFWQAETGTSFYEFDWPRDTSSTIEDQGWSGTDRGTTMTVIGHNTNNGETGLAGNFAAVQNTDSADSSPYIEWSGTFEDLGVPAGNVVTGYSDVGFFRRWFTVGDLSASYLGDDIGSGGALTIIEPGPSERVLIPDQSVATTDTVYTEISATPVTGLLLASDSAISLRLYSHHETTTAQSNVNYSTLRFVTSYAPPTEVPIATTVTATSTVVGALGVTRNFSTTVAATSTVTADVAKVVSFVTTVPATSTVTASLRNDHPRFATTISTVATVSGSLHSQLGFSTTISAVSTVTAKFIKAPFPTVVERLTGTSPESLGTHLITLPNHDAGDLIVVVIAGNGFPWPDVLPASVTHGWSTGGWWNDNGATGLVVSIVAEGRNTEHGTLTYAPEPFGVPIGIAYNAFTIRNGNNIVVGGSIWPADGGLEYAANPTTFANLDITNSRNVLWIAGYCANAIAGAGNATNAQASAPMTNYTNLTTTALSPFIDKPFVQTMERELHASSEKPGDLAIVYNAGGNLISQNFTIAIWGDERDESTFGFSFGNGSPAIRADRTASPIVDWTHTKVLTVDPGGGNSLHNYLSTNLGFAGVGGNLGFISSNETTTDSYDEWTGTFEDLGVPVGSKILGYRNAGFSYYFSEWGANVVESFFGDDLASRGALSIDDGTVRTLVGNQPSPGAVLPVTRANEPLSITGLNLDSDTAVTLRITTHAELDDTIAANHLNWGIDEIEISFEILAPVSLNPTDVAVESSFTIQGRPYPIITASTSGTAAGGSASVAIPLPAHTTGQLLLVTLTSQTAAAFVYNLVADGWELATALLDEMVYYKVAPTSSETFTLRDGSGDTGDLSYICHAIDNAKYAQARMDKIVDPAATNPPDIDLRGATRPYMFIVTRTQFAKAAQAIADPTAPPAGYFDMITVPGVDDVNPSFASASRIDYLSAETSIGNWVDGGDTGGAARKTMTIAVYDNIDAADDEQTLTMDVVFPFAQDEPGVTAVDNSRFGGFTLVEGSGNIDSSARNTHSVNLNAYGTGGVLSAKEGGEDAQSEYVITGTLEDLGVPVGHAVSSITGARFFDETSFTTSPINHTGILLYYTTPISLRIHIRVNTSPTLIGYRDDTVFNSAVSLNIGTQQLGLIPNQATETSPTELSNLEFLFDYQNVAAVLFDPATEVAVELPEFGIVVPVHIDATSVAVESPDLHIELRVDIDATSIAVETSDVLLATNRYYDTTVATVSAITPVLEIDRPLATTVAVISTVDGNIIEQLQIMTTVIAESQVTTATMIRDVPFETTIAATSTVTTDLFTGYESEIVIVSTVGADVEVARPLIANVNATSTVTGDMLRLVPFETNINATSAVTSSVNRLAEMETTVSVISIVAPVAVDVAVTFSTNIAATSEVNVVLGKTVKFITDIAVVSNVQGNIVEGLVFMSTTVAESAVVSPTMIRDVPLISTITQVSAVDVTLKRLVNYITTITATSDVTATVAIITNTLEVSFSETYFKEIEPYVIQLVTDTFDFTVIVNELDEVTLPETEDLGDVNIDMTDN